MEDIFLSFIVPVYNAAEHLAQCLDSLVHQDLPAEQYEILCINDGSTDSSPEILNSYAKKYPHLHPIHKENGGVTTARNAGLDAARGQYIWFVDADDFLKENVLASLRQKLLETHADRLIFGCYTFEDALSESEQEQLRQGTLIHNGPGQDSVVWRCLLKRAFLQQHNLSFSHPELTHGEDGLFMYEVCSHGPSHVDVQDVIYLYRVHSGSAETLASPASLCKKLRSYIRITEILGNYYQDGRKDARTANTYMTFLWFCLLTSASLPPKLSRDTRKQLKQAGLYPSLRLPECDISCSYMVSTDSLVGRIYDRLYLHLHRPWGYWGIWPIRQLLRLKKSMRS